MTNIVCVRVKTLGVIYALLSFRAHTGLNRLMVRCTICVQRVINPVNMVN
jgi:hypothetical protein